MRIDKTIIYCIDEFEAQPIYVLPQVLVGPGKYVVQTQETNGPRKDESWHGYEKTNRGMA